MAVYARLYNLNVVDETYKLFLSKKEEKSTLVKKNLIENGETKELTEVLKNLLIPKIENVTEKSFKSKKKERTTPKVIGKKVGNKSLLSSITLETSMIQNDEILDDYSLKQVFF